MIWRQLLLGIAAVVFAGHNAWAQAYRIDAWTADSGLPHNAVTRVLQTRDGFIWLTPHAFSWTPAGGMIDLGTLDGLYSESAAVNAGGQVVGYAFPDNNGNLSHAIAWTQAGGLVDLGTFGGRESRATASMPRVRPSAGPPRRLSRNTRSCGRPAAA